MFSDFYRSNTLPVIHHCVKHWMVFKRNGTSSKSYYCYHTKTGYILEVMTSICMYLNLNTNIHYFATCNTGQMYDGQSTKPMSTWQAQQTSHRKHQLNLAWAVAKERKQRRCLTFIPSTACVTILYIHKQYTYSHKIIKQQYKKRSPATKQNNIRISSVSLSYTATGQKTDCVLVSIWLRLPTAVNDNANT